MNEEQLQLPALPARWVDSGRIISENFHHLSARGTVCLVRAGRRNFRVPVTAVTASVEKNRSINMPGGGFRWNVNYGQHTIFGLKGCSMIRRSTWRPQCPPLGGPGPARSARARRMRWRRWRHRNKETAAAAALRGKVVMAARVTEVAATSGGAAAKSEDGAPWRPPPPESGGTSAFSDSWPCCCREPSRGSLLLEGFRVLLVGSGGWLLRNTAVYIT